MRGVTAWELTVYLFQGDALKLGAPDNGEGLGIFEAARPTRLDAYEAIRECTDAPCADSRFRPGCHPVQRQRHHCEGSDGRSHSSLAQTRRDTSSDGHVSFIFTPLGEG